MAVDQDNNIYVVGAYDAPCDFDPGPGTDMHSPNFADCFLSKFDSNGNFLWAKTWGGTGDDGAISVAVHPYGNVIVGGTFGSTDANFNPGPGAPDIHSTNGGHDAFLSKFTQSGDFLWARTWGSTITTSDLYWDSTNGVAIDSKGNAYATGQFGDKCDFDPTSGVDLLYGTSFLCKYTPDGKFWWARAQGKANPDTVGWSVCVDKNDNIYECGDSGGGFLTKYDSSGNCIETVIIGEPAFSCACDSDNSVFVAGSFPNTEYFYLCKYDSQENFQWGDLWGTNNLQGHPPMNQTFGVACDPKGFAYVAGAFFTDSKDPVDFDPGPTVDYHYATPGGNNGPDAFLSRFQPDGTW